MSSFKMIDVSEKNTTKRRAIASGKISMARSTIKLIESGQMKKGDVLKLAEVSGIMAAKNTSQILPLCHPLQIEAVKVDCKVISEKEVEVRCEVITTAKTGVEMEALCGVNAALLCIYDLAKAHDPVIKISDIILEKKEGGKTGNWVSPLFQSAKPDLRISDFNLKNYSAAVLTISDRCSHGEAIDTSGPALLNWLTQNEAKTFDSVKCVADHKIEIQKEILYFVKEMRVNLIVTTGGTGISPRDVTPEALLELNPKVISGVGEILRSSGSSFTDSAWLSRSSAYVIDQCLIVTLPGSLKACTQAMPELEKFIVHALKMIKGEGH